MKQPLPLPKQLAPLIIFFAAIILFTLVISNLRAARKKKSPPPRVSPQEQLQLRMELSPFSYGMRPVARDTDFDSQSMIPGVEHTLYQAAEYCDKGDFANAEDVLRTALVFHSANQKLLSMLGTVFYLQGKFRDAETIFRRQAFLRPGDSSVYNNLGAALAKQKKYQEAISTVEKVLKTEPDSSVAALNLSGIHSAAGNTREAIEYFKKAYDMLGERILPLSADPNFDNIRNQEGFIRILDQAKEKAGYGVRHHE